MQAISRFFLRTDLLDRIPEENAVGKDRFVLFRIFTFSGSAVCLGAVAKMFLTIPDPGIVPWIIMSLCLAMMINFYIIQKVISLYRGYIIMLLSAFTLLHVVAYTCGGIRTGGILYYGVIILYAYMLLGKKGGQIFALLFALNVIYFYIISTYTNWTSFQMFKNDVGLINEDFLINALFTFFLIASQGSYLQSGKNIVIQSLEKSKAELETKTHLLEQNNFLLKEYTRKLEKSNRELDQFALVASHDLKAPLRAIGTLSDLIEIELEGKFNNVSKNYLETIKKRVIRMDLLLNALLKYSHAARKTFLLKEVKVDILIENIIAGFRTDKSCKFTIKNIFPVIVADAEALKQVFEILLDNALRFNDKPHIEIELWSEEDKKDWIFKIKDNGPGIHNRFQEKIFIIFQTINDRDSFESTGAGLAIAKRIVENMGGAIMVDSTPGSGAEFSLIIPKLINTATGTEKDKRLSNSSIIGY